MHSDSESVPRHESVDHEHPTDAGMLSDDPQHVPGTGVLGDETLVREVPGGLRLPTPPAPSGADSATHASASDAPRHDAPEAIDGGEGIGHA
jgi:hypothetical protein